MSFDPPGKIALVEIQNGRERRDLKIKRICERLMRRISEEDDEADCQFLKMRKNKIKNEKTNQTTNKMI